MGELDGESKRDVSFEAKKRRKRSNSFADCGTAVNNDEDNDNCLPEHSISKKKKKKKERINEKKCVDEDESTQKENHSENISLVTECMDEIQKTNEKAVKKVKKSSQNSHSLVGNESEQFETESTDNSLGSIVRKKKKKKDKEKDQESDDNPVTSNDHSHLLTERSEINTIIHHQIENLEDGCDLQEYISTSENHSKELGSKKKKNKGTAEELHLENIETCRKERKRKKCVEFAEDSDSNTELHMSERKRKDEISNKLNKQKDKEKETNHDKSIDLGHTPPDKNGSENRITPLFEIKKEFSDDENASDASGGIIIDDDGGAARVKRPKFSNTELHVAKIVAYDESDEEEVHPLKQHHILDPEQVAKLAELHIVVRHDVPPQHNVEQMAGTRVPSKKEKLEMQKYIEIKNGPFDGLEDTRIVHNWKKFCRRYGWDRNIIHPFLQFKQKGFFYLSSLKERRKFVQLLAKGLPNRTLYSVYHRFRNIYSRHKQDRYSLAEDQELLQSIRRNLDQGEKPNYAMLAKKFNRTRASVWRRYDLLMRKRKKASGSV